MGAMQQALMMARSGGSFQSGPQVNSYHMMFYGLGDAIASVFIDTDGMIYDTNGSGDPPAGPSFYYQPTSAGIGIPLWVRVIITNQSAIFPPNSEVLGTFNTWYQIGATGVSFGVRRSATTNGSSSIEGYMEFSQTNGGTIVASVPYTATATIEV